MTASGATQVTGAGYAPTGQVQWQRTALTAGTLYDEQAMVLQGGSQAGNASLLQAQDGAWQIQGDPTDAAFLVAERKLVPGTTASDQPAQRVTEIPFTSERKMMSVIVREAPPGTGLPTGSPA